MKFLKDFVCNIKSDEGTPNRRIEWFGTFLETGLTSEYNWVFLREELVKELVKELLPSVKDKFLSQEETTKLLNEIRLDLAKKIMKE